MRFNPSEPRLYHRRKVPQPGRWEIDMRGVLDNGLEVKRQRRVFPLNPAAGKIGKRQAAAQAYEEWQRWNRHGQVLRPGETPALARTGGMKRGHVPTFTQFAPDFMEFCASPNGGPKGANSPATLRYKESDLRIHLLPAFGSLRLDQLTTADVDRFVVEKSKQQYKSNTIGKYVAILRRMLEVAKRFEMIDSVPVLHRPRVERDRVKALDMEEAARFLETIPQVLDDRRAVLVELYLRTGLRCGEGLALYPADFNLTAATPTVRVERSWGSHGYGLPKGRKTRTVPVPRSVARRVEALIATDGVSARSSSVHVFRSDTDPNQPWTSRQVRGWVKRIGKAADTQHVHTHMLRHTFGTECARRGVPLLTLKEWMGHSNVKTTMGYLHLAAPDHLRWAELLGD